MPSSRRCRGSTVADPGAGKVDVTATAENPDGSFPTRHGWVDTLRQSLDRPLTSYYLLVGASGLLLVLGLVMVLSSSSVWSYKQFDGDSYAVFLKQLTW